MNNDTKTTIDELKKRVEDFVSAREWEPFHNGKNLSMALAIEAAELMEHFRFSDTGESNQIVQDEIESIRHELADVLIASLSFANRYSIDLSSAVIEKLKLNDQKYPIDQSKGSAKKYIHYQKKS